MEFLKLLKKYKDNKGLEEKNVCSKLNSIKMSTITYLQYKKLEDSGIAVTDYRKKRIVTLKFPIQPRYHLPVRKEEKMYEQCLINHEASYMLVAHIQSEKTAKLRY